MSPLASSWRRIASYHGPQWSIGGGHSQLDPERAVDAMDSVDNDRRLLQVRTKYSGDDAISVEIEDTGPGIDPKKSDSIFDAFFTTKPHGMGLGLAICRTIIERHEGQLVASSAKAHGANFRITLPQMKLKTVRATEASGHSKESSPTADESVASPDN